MRNVTSSFKTAIREPRQIDGKVIVGSQTLTSNVLNQIIPKFNANLFKTVMKGVEIDSNTSIPIGTNVNPQFALFVNNSFEWVDYGNYKVYKSEKNEDTLSHKITAYDKILESMIDYDLEVTYPITVRNYWIAIFTKLNWNTAGIPDTFTNSTKMINQDVHSGIGYTYRDVLDELCTISGVWLVDKNGIPSIVSPNETNEIIDKTYMKDTNVTIKDKVFFNSLVFSRVEGSDNIYRKDDTSIEQNGLHEFKISDNQLLSTNDRDLYIDELWNYIKDFEYYSFEIDTVGIVFLEALDKFNLSVDNQNYSTILLNDETYISQGLTETIYSESPNEMQTEYKYADTSDKKLNQTYINVDKQNQKIDAIVSTQNEQGETLNQIQIDNENIKSTTSSIQTNLETNYYDITKVDELIQNAETGLTNTFLRAGGNNLLRNTAPYFMESENTAEYWNGNVKRIKETDSISGYALLLQNGTISQTITLSPNQYAIKFKYKKLTVGGTCTVQYNGRTIELNEEEGTVETTGPVNSGQFEFKVTCDTDDSFEIYDLMLNVGQVAMPWTQNANESTSDTVNISKGITVSSNTSNTLSTMNDDGFKVKNATTNEEVMVATDDGGKFKNIEANRSSIAGVLMQKIKNQTWISGV